MALLVVSSGYHVVLPSHLASKGAEGQVEEKEEDFVYDVYYSEESPKMELEQL